MKLKDFAAMPFAGDMKKIRDLCHRCEPDTAMERERTAARVGRLHFVRSEWILFESGFAVCFLFQ